MRSLLEVSVFAAVLLLPSIGHSQSDDWVSYHKVAISAAYGRWDQVYLSSDGGYETDSMEIQNGYGLCGFSTSGSGVSPSAIWGSTTSYDICWGAGVTSGKALSKLVWSDAFKYTGFPQYENRPVGVASAACLLRHQHISRHRTLRCW